MIMTSFHDHEVLQNLKKWFELGVLLYLALKNAPSGQVKTGQVLSSMQ